MGGFPKTRGFPCRNPHNEDCAFLGSILGLPSFGNPLFEALKERFHSRVKIAQFSNKAGFGGLGQRREQCNHAFGHEYGAFPAPPHTSLIMAPCKGHTSFCWEV